MGIPRSYEHEGPGPRAPSWSPGSPAPQIPELPPELRLPAGAGEILLRLEFIWLHASAETIGRDIQEGRRLLGRASSGERDLAARYVSALERLERWLRDF